MQKERSTHKMNSKFNTNGKFKMNSKRNITLTILFALVSALTVSICHFFLRNETVSGINGSYIVKSLIFFLLMICLFYILGALAHTSRLTKGIQKIKIPFFHGKWQILVNTVIITLLLLPAFLALYPGYQAYDGPAQVTSFLAGAYPNTQPVIHTFIIGQLYKISHDLTGSYTLGLALYSVLQAATFIFAMVFTTNKLIKWNVPDLITALTLLFTVVNPMVQVFVFTTTKDAYFASFMLLFIVEIVDIYKNESTPGFAKTIAAIIFAILMCLFRKQGLYILVLTLPVSLLVQGLRGKSKLAGSTSINDSNSTSQPASAARTASANQPAEFKPAHKLLALATIFLTSILICFLIFKLAYPALGIEKDAAAEKLSVPIQQITRVVATHPERLTEEDMVEIEKFIPAENLATYVPQISDPVKAGFNNEYYEENSSQFWSLWLRIGKANKTEYINQIMYGILGYFYPGSEATNGWGYLCPIVQLPDWTLDHAGFFILYKNYLLDAGLNMFHNTFLISTLVCIGLPMWIHLMVLYLGLIRRKRAYWLALIPLALFSATNLLGPVCCIRYVIPLYMTLPIEIASLFVDTKRA